MGAPPSIDEMLGRMVGRYRVVSHLASGGMAELFIARQEAMGGFEKEIVVKILQPRYAENPRVVQMFLDEARLAAKLNHASIVHVYDVAEEQTGSAAGLKYIAMEYIRGETVTDIVKLYTVDARNQDLLRRATRSTILPESWKDYFRKRLR